MRRVSGFTLVELLVVIAIMVIIMGFSVPMFSKISFGNAVDGSSRMISSQLSLARAEAVAKRQYIAIVMPRPEIKTGASNVPFTLSSSDDDYNFKSFRAAIVQPISGAPNQFTFDKWFPGTEWGFLPTGAVLAEADDDGVHENSGQSGCECIEKYTSTTPKVLDTREVYSSWLSSNELEGDSPNTSTTGMTIVNGIDGNDGVRAIVFKPNGRVAGSGNMFVTIVEGVPVVGNNGNFVLTNGSEGNNNMRLIKIDQYTGKLKFLSVNYP